MGRVGHAPAGHRDADPRDPRYAELVRAGEGNEDERLALLEEHRERVLEQLAEIERNLELVDYKIGLYRERLCDY